MAAQTNTGEGRFQSSGGLQIFYRWNVPADPRAVILVCHGVNSHSGYYQWALEQFAAAGYAAYALDLRGRGRSEGERFYIDGFTDYTDDLGGLHHVARERHPGLPVYIFGHSAGGVVSTTYALDHQGELAGLVCESYALAVYAPDFALAALKGLDHLAPHAHVLKLPMEGFSRDPTMVERMKTDPLLDHEVQPVRTVAELARAGDRLRREFGDFRLPVLILHGTADKATKPEGSRLFEEKAGSEDKTLKLYEGHAHDLFLDYGKEEVMADVLAWLDARAPARSAAAAYRGAGVLGRAAGLRGRAGPGEAGLASGSGCTEPMRHTRPLPSPSPSRSPTKRLIASAGPSSPSGVFTTTMAVPFIRMGSLSARSRASATTVGGSASPSSPRRKASKVSRSLRGSQVATTARLSTRSASRTILAAEAYSSPRSNGGSTRISVRRPRLMRPTASRQPSPCTASALARASKSLRRAACSSSRSSHAT